MIGQFPRFSILLACGFAAASLTVLPAPANSQIVQALPDPAQETLNDALRRLSRNPESVPALVAAGRASLELDDVDAALGFFNRAQSVAPEDGRVLVGLALVAVRRGEAVTALQLFRNAEAAGEHMAPHAAARGLAYDLVGRNDRAQRLYRLALSQDEDAEVIRRLALSYAIAGNADASEATLLPLLQRQDRGAYRTRAFALAIRGRDEEAIAIAETMLPQRIANRLAPYFRYMPRLTRAQQAAAANLGRFPAANEVGRDTSDIAAYSDEDESANSPPRRQSAAQRLEPQGEPLGPTPVPSPSVAQAMGELQGELPPIAQQQQPEPPARAVQQEPQLATVEETEVAAAEESVSEAFSPPAAAPQEEEQQIAEGSADDIGPSFSLTQSLGVEEAINSASAFDLRASGNNPAVVAQETEAVNDAPPLDLAEAFADFTEDGAPAPSMAGAVDITTIDPPRERPEPATPPPPEHPARHWVQLGIGQDISAFRFDLRRHTRNADGLLDGLDAWTTPWGQTNRLLVGPFDSAREAQQMVTSLAEAGVDSFRFSSREGEEIQQLD